MLLLRAVQLILGLALAASTASASSSCLLPNDVGLCRGVKLRFYFNNHSGKCESFIYGGCQGNANNFGSLMECHNTCKDHLDEPEAEAKAVHVRTPHCLDPPLRSMIDCRGFFPRYTFNSRTLQCESYIYGGCGATANVYGSREQCQTTCYFGDPLPVSRPARRRISHMRSGGFPRPPVGGPTDAVVLGPTPVDDVLCKLPPVTPHLRACLAFIPMWTYDSRLVFVDFLKGPLEAMTRCTLYNIFYEENAFF
jgi:hypothetical protein